MYSLAPILIVGGLCFAAAVLGAKVTAPQIHGWYAGLRKPTWTPPRIIFPIVWPILYLMIAMAGWTLWHTPASGLRSWSLIAYFIQLSLNAAWSPVFFGGHRLFAALMVIVALDIALLATIILSWHLDRTAALLLMPYLAWTLFATALNASIWKRN